LYYAIDRDTLAASASSSRADSPLVSGTWAFSPSLARYSFAPERADALLNDAGWRLDGRGYRVRAGIELGFTLATTDDPVLTAVASDLIRQWRALGIQATVQAVPTTTLTRDMLATRSFDAVLFVAHADLDPDAYSLWASTDAPRDSRNFSGFADSRMDRVLEGA